MNLWHTYLEFVKLMIVYICTCFQPVLSKSNRIFQIRNLISVSSTAKSNFKELGKVNVIGDHIS